MKIKSNNIRINDDREHVVEDILQIIIIMAQGASRENFVQMKLVNYYWDAEKSKYVVRKGKPKGSRADEIIYAYWQYSERQGGYEKVFYARDPPEVLWPDYLEDTTKTATKKTTKKTTTKKKATKKTTTKATKS